MGLPLKSRRMVTSIRAVGGGGLYLRPRLVVSCWAPAASELAARPNPATTTQRRKRERWCMGIIVNGSAELGTSGIRGLAYPAQCQRSRSSVDAVWTAIALPRWHLRLALPQPERQQNGAARSDPQGDRIQGMTHLKAAQVHRHSHGNQHQAAEGKKGQQHRAEDETQRIAPQQQDGGEHGGRRPEGQIQNRDRLREAAGIAHGLRRLARKKGWNDLGQPVVSSAQGHQQEKNGRYFHRSPRTEPAGNLRYRQSRKTSYEGVEAEAQNAAVGQKHDVEVEAECVSEENVDQVDEGSRPDQARRDRAT